RTNSRRVGGPPDPTSLPPAHVGTDRHGDTRRGRPRPDGNPAELLGGDRARRHLVAHLRCLDADPPDLHERHDPLATAGNDPLLRFADGLGGRRLGPTAAGPGCGRVGIWGVIRGGSWDLRHRPASTRALATSERAGGHGASGCGPGPAGPLDSVSMML